MDGYRYIPIFIDRKTDRYRYPYWEREKRRRRRLGRGGGKRWEGEEDTFKKILLNYSGSL